MATMDHNIPDSHPTMTFVVNQSSFPVICLLSAI